MTKSEVPMYEKDEERYKTISGNASAEVKQSLADGLSLFMLRGRGFADSIGGRLEITVVDIHEKSEEPQKMEATVACEIVVEQDMINGGKNLHGGCSAYLVDLCSTMPLLALAAAQGDSAVSAVSQVINMVYHSPATIGDRLRITSTSISMGTRALSARCEIWNATRHRLVASGVHIKMAPNARL